MSSSDKPGDEISKRFAIPPGIKNPFSPTPEPPHVEHVPTALPFSIDPAAGPRPFVGKIPGWRRLIVEILAGVTMAGAAGAASSSLPPRAPDIVRMINTDTPSGRSDPPVAPPLLVFGEAGTPAHDDSADPFGQIVKKVVEEMVDMAIEKCFGFVAHLVWAAFHARRSKLAQADREALARLDSMFGTDNAWVGSAETYSGTRGDEPSLTEEELLSQAPAANEAVWRAVGEQLVKSAHGPLRPFLCGKKGPLSSGVEKAVDWIAGQTRDALFHGVFDEALLFAAAGLAVTISKQGLEILCGPEKPV